MTSGDQCVPSPENIAEGDWTAHRVRHESLPGSRTKVAQPTLLGIALHRV
jgi:hypothetical protein